MDETQRQISEIDALLAAERQRCASLRAILVAEAAQMNAWLDELAAESEHVLDIGDLHKVESKLGPARRT